MTDYYTAERYPLPMECPECGRTMRPVHKHRLPDMPLDYFCTFCDAMIHEDHPGIRFREPKTNLDVVRSMNAEELAWFYAKRIALCYGCESSTMEDCAKCWLDLLKSAPEE